MSRFIDSEKNEEAIPVSFGFVGESDVTSTLDNIRSFLLDKYDASTVSITHNARLAVANNERETKLWVLKYIDTEEVELVTDDEYFSRRN